MKEKIKDSVRLLRFSHYVKNGVIFLPLFFAGEITRPALFLKTLLACIVFSLVASVVYIFNDLCDLQEDRKHPNKISRPLALGRVSVSQGWMVIAVLLLSGLTLAVTLLPYAFTGLCLLYLMLNVLYSLKLKQIAILDITIVAAGFVIRLFLGGIVGNIALTEWIILMTFLLALLIALGKRREDVLMREKTGGEVQIRKSLYGYNLEFINGAMIVIAGILTVSYIMYAVSPATVARLGSDKIYFSSLIVILGVLRYLQIVFVQRKGGAPTEILFQDRFLQGTIILWLLFFAVLLYFRH